MNDPSLPEQPPLTLTAGELRAWLDGTPHDAPVALNVGGIARWAEGHVVGGHPHDPKAHVVLLTGGATCLSL